MDGSQATWWNMRAALRFFAFTLALLVVMKAFA